jgi:mono/diheme cytochrome c family protein
MNRVRPLLALLAVTTLVGVTLPGDVPDAARGYELLRTKAYVPSDFDQEVFDELWRSWPEPLRSRAEKAGPEERRRMAFRRYGFTADEEGRPHQYVVDSDGRWTINCLACHSGKVAGRAIPGSPNTHLALETLTEDVRATKTRLGKPLRHMDLGILFMPLGTTNGTTNAVNFGVALMAGREADLSLRLLARPPEMLHHDMDAPPWWNYKKRKRLYADGFAVKSHRSLMPFLLVPSNGPEKFREWEADFRAIERWIETIEAPKYPWPIDAGLAARGKRVFEKTCARCHGTYGEQETYPGRVVPIEEIGTDPLRLRALTPKQRAEYGESWFGRFGKDKAVAEPGGYQAPPLDGIWASAPYFHNGSVPTLWHLLRPDSRPVVWKRTEDGYDRERVGLEVEVLDAVPDDTGRQERRTYFDATRPGKSAAGHTYPADLDEAEKRALLEYLKSL